LTYSYLFLQIQGQPSNILDYGVWALVVSVLVHMMADNAEKVIEWRRKSSETKGQIATNAAAADTKLTQDIIQNMLGILQSQLGYNQDNHTKSTESLFLALSALSDAVSTPKELKLILEAIKEQITAQAKAGDARISSVNRRLTAIEAALDIDPKRDGRQRYNDALDDL
jgi:hypothetical protein